jgi:hypothetical protein
LRGSLLDWVRLSENVVYEVRRYFIIKELIICGIESMQLREREFSFIENDVAAKDDFIL